MVIMMDLSDRIIEFPSLDRSIDRSLARIDFESIGRNDTTQQQQKLFDSIRKQTQIKEGEEFKFIRLSKLINLCKQDKNSFEDRRKEMR